MSVVARTVHLTVGQDDPRAVCGAGIYTPPGESYTGAVTLCEACRRVSLAAPDLETVVASLEATQAAHDDATDPRVNPCPECPDGEVVITVAHNGAHDLATCSAGCGWSA